MQVSFYKTLLAYEHRTRRWIGAAVDLQGGRGTTVRKRLGNDIEKLRELASKPHRGTVTAATTDGRAATTDEDRQSRRTRDRSVPGPPFTVDGVEVTSTMSRDEYLSGVRKIQEHIAAGEIYQANLTQRWTVPYGGEPGRLYAALRKASPVPFGFYMNTGRVHHRRRLAGELPHREGADRGDPSHQGHPAAAAPPRKRTQWLQPRAGEPARRTRPSSP